MNELKKLIIDYLTRSRKIVSMSNIKNPVRVKHEALIEAYELILTGIIKSEKKGDKTMKDLQDLLGETVNVEDIQVRERSGISKMILSSVDKIKPGQAVKINKNVAKWNSFQNQVYILKRQNKLPKSFRPIKRGDDFYLANISKVKEG